MKLKCRIHEKDYDLNLATGATFSEEYNETLDSGTIIVDQIPKIKGLKPYEDVYIWNADQQFNGYVNVGEQVPASDIGTISHDEHPITFGQIDYKEIQDTIFGTQQYWKAPILLSADNTYFSFTGGIYYNVDGAPYPCLMGAWASNFLYGLEYRTSFPRYGINDITFKFTFTQIYFTTISAIFNVPVRRTRTVVGYYNLPKNKYDSNGNRLGIDSEGKLILTKNDDFVSDSYAPNELHVPFSINIPPIYPTWEYGNTIQVSNETLILYTNATSVAVPTSELQLCTITNIETISGFNYAYYYLLDGSSKAASYAVFTINNLTKEQILNLTGLETEVNAGGYNVKCICSAPEFDSTNNRINMYFQIDPSAITGFTDPGGFTLSFHPVGGNSNTATMWQYFTNSFNIRVVENANTYPIDRIINEKLLDNAYINVTSTKVMKSFIPNFFKHLLVDNFSCDMLSLEQNQEDRLYKYKINLFSETKRLEKIICPNISITQPIVGTKRTILYYLKQFVNLYSPKIKFIDEDGKWVYKNKYSIDDRLAGDYFFDPNTPSARRSSDDEYVNVPLREIFTDDIFAPELSLTAPSLKDILSRLMIVKDCIPVVRNDVIYAMKISDTHGNFIINNDNFSFITETMNSANYSTALRREYGGAISQKNTAHMVEFLGFRTAGGGEGLMTLDNMVLQTRFPIYKINKLYMCCYKTVNINNTNTGNSYTKLILVKQDITKLVLQNTVRNALAADWTTIQNGDWRNITVDQMSKQRVFTIGYDIGSNVISGWGEKVSYISDKLGWTRAVYTYIELIMRRLDEINALGVNSYQFLNPGEEATGSLGWTGQMVTPVNNDTGNVANKLKGLFFQMDYTAMYSGALIYSKENTEDDDVQTSDNCSSALSVLEVDGLFEREKVNRLSNNEISFIARFDSVTQMNDENHNNIIGAEYDNDGETAIIYHREYQIFEDCVLANFVGTHDYVLRNYFTSVFAKYRTYSYAGYDESVNRAETDKYIVFLSDDRCYYEKDEIGVKDDIITSVLSAFSESIIDDSLNVKFPNQINGGYFVYYSNGLESTRYFSDVNQFVAGYSLCFNIRLFDNITNGNYISEMNCYGPNNDNPNDTVYVGSQLAWYKRSSSATDGFVPQIGCYFGHFEESDFYSAYTRWNNNNKTALYNKILKLPKIPETPKMSPTFHIGGKYTFCKDDKEIIDFTLQYELVNQDDTVIFSEWLIKLTDYSNYLKLSHNTRINNRYDAPAIGFTIKYWCVRGDWNILYLDYGGYPYDQGIRMIFSALAVEQQHILQAGTFLYDTESPEYMAQGTLLVNVYLKMTPKMITRVVTENGRVVRISVQVDLLIQRRQTRTVNVDFQRENGDGYEFVYIGRIVPQDQQGKNVIKLIDHVGEENAVSQTGYVSIENSPYDFLQTMYILVSSKPVKQSLIYGQEMRDNLPSHLKIVDTSIGGFGITEGFFGQSTQDFSDIFRIAKDEAGRPYIQYNYVDGISETDLGDDYRSVQYWYRDIEGDGYMHFVFGVNTRDENDNNVTSKKIYISTLKNRSTKVYNYLHREAAKVMDFGKAANAAKYGEQYYEELDEEDD